MDCWQPCRQRWTQTRQLQTGEGGAGLEELLASAFNGQNVNGTFTFAAPANQLNPFGGDVQAPADAQSVTELGTTFSAFINPNPFPILYDFDFDGAFNDMGPPVRINSDPTTFGGPDDQILGNPADADGNGFLDTFENQVFDPYDDGWFAPSLPGPGPAPETLEELAVDLALGGFPTGPTTLHIGGDPWDDPDSDFFGAASTALQDGQTVQMDDILIIPPENGPSKIGGRGVFVSVGQSMGGFPVNDDCSGLLIEAFTGTAQRGAQLWVSADFAPNDSFANLSQAHVLRCFPDAGG